MDFDDMPEQSLEEQISEVTNRELWLLREAMTLEKPSLDEQGHYVVPARLYMPYLKEALAIWEEAGLRAHSEIPKSVNFMVKQSSRLGMVNSVAEVAKVSPEARRYWLIDLLHNLMVQAIEILENEGRPALPPPTLRKLAKMRPQGWAK